MRLLYMNQSTMCNISRAVLILTLALSAHLSSAGYEHTCSSILTRPHRNGRCGRVLTDTVILLCNSFSRFLVKRDTEREVDQKLKGVFLNKEKALSYLTKREARESIVCECCINSCTHTELIEYCDFTVYDTRPEPPSEYRAVKPGK
ncbi:hypothetical protein Btru_067162 [Bulinus truncatus]|nr:hypothetical protein Btru_067162 [Bulinus truncatus]